MEAHRAVPKTRQRSAKRSANSLSPNPQNRQAESSATAVDSSQCGGRSHFQKGNTHKAKAEGDENDVSVRHQSPVDEKTFVHSQLSRPVILLEDDCLLDSFPEFVRHFQFFQSSRTQMLLSSSSKYCLEFFTSCFYVPNVSN